MVGACATTKDLYIHLEIYGALLLQHAYNYGMGALTTHTSDALLHPASDPGQPAIPIPLETVRDELRKIVGSAGFIATERSRKLLEFLVNETLAGRGGRIKAYCIGTGVFGRPESFDPQKDPIVRIEAARLRRELEHYYLTDGVADPVIIDIPKGAYVPHFLLRAADHAPETARPVEPQSATRKEARWKHGARWGMAGVALVIAGLLGFGIFTESQRTAVPSSALTPGLLVKPLTDLTHSRDSAILAQGLTERIIEKTARFKELAVIPGDSEATQVPTSMARYEFGGTLRQGDGQLVVQTRLVDRMDGRVIWADSYNVPLQPQQLFGVELHVADQIATRIAEPSGILFEAERRQLLDAPPDSLNAYLCTLSAYVYRVTSSALKFPAVRACLEQAVAKHPDYATAWALLSLVNIDEFRFRFAASQDAAAPAIERAYDAARRATELDPVNVRAQQALMMALFFREEFDAALDVGKRALALNPNDVELKGEYGYRLALTGNWPEGCNLIKEARDNSARKLAYLTTALSLCHFFRGDVTGAASLVVQADAEENSAYHIIAAALLADAGRMDESARHRDWLQVNTPRQMAQLLVDLPQRLARPEDQRKFIDALRKAGFAVN